MINLNKRVRLIDSAGILFHQNGLHATSLADIAKHADIPIGNVYYYFKTKEELALAVIEMHREQFSGAYALLNEKIDDPRLRLIEAVRTFDKKREDFAKYGCPIGKIVDDGSVARDNVARAAAQVFAEFVDWAALQFEKLGHGDDAIHLAVSLLAGVQGGILLAKSRQDPQVLSDEVARLVDWLESVPNKKIQIGKAAIKA